MPSVEGLPADDALKLLEDRELVVEIAMVSTSSVPAGTVLEQVPEAGSLVLPGQDVIIEVSSTE